MRTNNKAYISGPMTGLPDLNRTAFYEAEAALVRSRFCRSRGHVYNPARLDEGTPLFDTREEYLRADIHAMTENGTTPVDVVVQLPGWETSRGAVVEHMVAVACGIRCVSLEEAVSWTEPRKPERKRDERGREVDD